MGIEFKDNSKVKKVWRWLEDDSDIYIRVVSCTEKLKTSRLKRKGGKAVCPNSEVSGDQIDNGSFYQSRKSKRKKEAGGRAQVQLDHHEVPLRHEMSSGQLDNVHLELIETADPETQI